MKCSTKPGYYLASQKKPTGGTVKKDVYVLADCKRLMWQPGYEGVNFSSEHTDGLMTCSRLPRGTKSGKSGWTSARRVVKGDSVLHKKTALRELMVTWNPYD